MHNLLKTTKFLALILICLFAVACGQVDEAPISSTNSESAVGEAPTSAVEVDEAADAESQDKITVQFAVSDFELARYRNLIETFEEENPEIEIRLVSINEILELEGFGPQNQISEESVLLLAQSADVFDSSYLSGLSDATLVQDLTPFIEEDDGFDSADFYADTVVVGDGAIFEVPFVLNVTMMRYNKTLFDASGLQYPQAGWTWDDFLATAQALTITDGEATTQWGVVEVVNNPGIYVQARIDTQLLDRTLDPPAPNLEEQGVVDALSQYVGLFTESKVAPVFEANGGIGRRGGAADLIQANQAAMWIGAGNIGRNNDETTGVVAFPVDSADSNSTLVQTRGLALSAGSANPAAAWAWMSFLSRQQGVINTNPANLTVPARASVAEAGGYWNAIPQAEADMLRYALDHAFTDTNDIVYRALATAADDVLNNGLSVEDALAAAQESAEIDIEAAVAAANETESFAVAPQLVEGASEEAVTILFSTGVGRNSLDIFRPLADQFTAENPDIIVELTPPNFQGGQFGFETIAANTDCFSWFSEVQNPDHQSAILTMDPFVEADAEFNADDLIPALTSQFRYQGQLWGIPANQTPIVLEYNRAVFDDKGLPYPANGWSLQEFVNVAVNITSGEDEEKIYGFLPEAYETNILVLFLEKLGVTFIDTTADPPTINFADPEMASALLWYADLSTKFDVKPTLITDVAELAQSPLFRDRELMINEGRAAIWTSTGQIAGPRQQVGNLTQIRDAMDIGVVALPAGVEGSGSGFTPATGYFVSSSTQNRRECWEWLKFLSNAPEASTGIPGRFSVLESAEYRDRIGVERADAYLASVANGAGESTIFRLFNGDVDWMSSSTFWLGQAYQNIIDGTATVDDALADAQATFDTYRNCIIANDGQNDNTVQNECLAEADPTLPQNVIGQGRRRGGG